MKKLLLYIALIGPITHYSQNRIDIEAVFDIDQNTISIQQIIEYTNASSSTLDTIYLNDWSNSYSSKSTPLAIRISEEFSTSFHFASNEERGFTSVTKLANDNGLDLFYERLKAHPDVIKVALDQPLKPGGSYKLNINYIVKIPSDKFTSYGYNDFKDFNLKYWYITPAIFDGSWHYYSNKNLDDLYIPKADLYMQLEYPRNYLVTSELDVLDNIQNDSTQTLSLFGKDRVDSRLNLHKLPIFRTTQTDDFAITSDITEKDLHPTDKAIITDKITQFISHHLGPYPHKTLLVTDIDADKDPVYGLNQLPNFIRPFPEHFQFELTLLKTSLSNYLNNTLLINPRKDQWLKDGIQVYYLMKYIEENYPDMKLIGSLANIWGIRAFHLADLKFNAQYNLMYMHMARTNRDQPLSMAKDSLLKFNANLANKYKAGAGFKYLDDYINDNTLETTIKAFFKENKLLATSPTDFQSFLTNRTEKDLSWFFDDYVNTRKKIDFKLKIKDIQEDSVSIFITNKRDNKMPVSLYTLNNDSIISKSWVTDIGSGKHMTVAKDQANKLVLNYENIIPEYNLRDNWKSLRGSFFNRKPLQLRLFQDIEDPSYNQIFFMPIIQYRNIYDGLSLGMRMYNKTILRRAFNYKIAPEYGLSSKKLTGTVSFLMYENIDSHKDLYSIIYGISGSYRSYADGLFRRRITPTARFYFRDKDNYRSNERRLLEVRYLDIYRDEDVNNISDSEEPNYGIFNVNYLHTDNNLLQYKKWFFDFQLTKDFSKISFNYLYRKLFESNRQLSVRVFAGSFIFNNNPEDSDYFSFALDRPTDYLFDYDYLGRSEETGIFSQQIIIAEGGFKSQLEPAFSNQWIATANFSTSIWRYIQAYGDIGWVKNKGNSAKFVYDSGIRLNLVQDYFEIYFPVYSNLGWEIAQDNYDEKIRFIFTVDPETLFGLFRRKWY